MSCVSKKIRKLMHEGKPQKQAIAIAYSMCGGGKDMSEQDKDYTSLSQEQTNYTTLSTKKGQACANCLWFRAYGEGEDDEAKCHLVFSFPKPILPTGWCDRWEADPETPVYEPPPQPVYIVEEPESEAEMSHDHNEGELLITPTPPTLLNRAKTALTGGLKPGQTILKAADGRRLLFMVTSNSYQDREKETILSEALKTYADSCWVENGGFVGANDHFIWHAKGLGSISDLLYADIWNNAFLVEIWKEKPTGLANAYYNYLEHTDEPHGASHGFKYLWSDRSGAGEFRAIRKTESSSLPLSAAANLLTFSGVIKMSKRDDYLKTLFKEQLGIEVEPTDLQNDFKGVIDKLAAAGVQHKAEGEPTDGATFTPELATLVMKLAENQADTVGEIDDLTKRFDQWETAEKDKAEAAETAQNQLTDALKAIHTRLDGIDEALKQRPRASQSDATVETDPATTASVTRAMQPEHDPFWGDLGVEPTPDGQQ